MQRRCATRDKDYLTGQGRKLGLDATKKLSGEGFQRPRPPRIDMQVKQYIAGQEEHHRKAGFQFQDSDAATQGASLALFGRSPEGEAKTLTVAHSLCAVTAVLSALPGDSIHRIADFGGATSDSCLQFALAIRGTHRFSLRKKWLVLSIFLCVRRYLAAGSLFIPQF